MHPIEPVSSRRARPIFIVSSGRSGTAMMEKLLSYCGELEMHHEYLCTHIQPVAARYYMGQIGPFAVRQAVERLHGRAMHYADRPVWGDSSNKLSWIVDVLAEMFPDARFVHLVRDGRKVVASYHQKLGDEIYDDAAVRALLAHIEHPATVPAPPPEKRYWWPIPVQDPARLAEFRTYSQFDRIAFHWGEINRVLMEKLGAVDLSRVLRVRLEDLVSDPDELETLFAFLGLKARPELFALLHRPHNVKVPVDTQLSSEEEARFFALAGDVMTTLGYDRAPAYAVAYG